jgi:hypothetical protein
MASDASERWPQCEPRTRGDVHEDNIRLRDAVAGKISRGQLADAQQLAVRWVPKPERF